jgi:hypothetical protein
MRTILDSLRFRHVDSRARQTRRDGLRSVRKAVLAFHSGWDTIALEPRAMLSNVSWINAAGGDWNTGSNWNTGNVPGTPDHVTIDISPGITVTHAQNNADSVNDLIVTGANTLSISNGSLAIASASTIDGTVNLSGGALEGAGSLTFTGALTWTSGTMSGTGQTIATGAVSIDSGILDARSFTNDGTVTLSGTLSFDNSASFTNAAPATFSAQTGATLHLGDSSSPTFNNAGNFNAQAIVDHTVTDDGVAFTSAGNVTVSSGTLALDDPGGTDSGSFTVALNATLDFGEKATTLSSQSSVNGQGTVTFDNNDVATIDGDYNLGSLDTVMYATADEPGFNGPPFGIPPTYLFGTMDLTTGQFTSISTTNQLINSLTVVPGGSLYAGAAPPTPYLYTISPSGATSQFGTVSEPSDSASFDGLASDGAGGFFSDTVTKNGDSTFTATLEHISADGNSSSVIGTMGASFGSANTGNLTFGPDGNLYFDAENASGAPTLYAVNPTTGALTAVGSGLNTSNPLTLATNGTVLYGIDTYAQVGVGVFPAIYTIDTTTGAATQIGMVSGLDVGYYLDTIAPHAPAITPTSTTIVQNNAVVNFDGTLTSLGGKLNISSGTANLGSNSVNLESLNLGGTLTGTGTLTVTGALSWYGGTMAGTGQTIAEGAVDILNATLDTRSFTSDSTARLSATLSFDNSASFTSAATASFDTENGAALAAGDSSAPSFNNAGTFNAPALFSDFTATDNGVAFANTGTVNVTSGILSFSDTTLTNNSVINQSGTGTLQVKSSATLNNTSSGTYTWSDGTLQVDGALTSVSAVTIPTGATLDGIGMISGPLNVQAGGNLAPGDAVDTPGILHAASLTLTTGANFDVDLAGTTAGTKYDQLSSTGTVNLAGATLNLAGNYPPVAGDVFTIVTAASVNGTFNSLAQGAIIPFNGSMLEVRYTANTVTLTDAKTPSTPTIAWPTPTAIVYGTVLGSTQLDAMASYAGTTVVGTYNYSDPTNSEGVLNAGLSQTLTVHFTPTDTIDYTSATSTTTINVLAATLTVAVNPATRSYGQANPELTVTYDGFALGDGPAVLSGALAFHTIAAQTSNVGSYGVQADGLTSQNYAIKYVPAVVSVVPASLNFTAVNKVKKLKARNPKLTFTESGLALGQSAKNVFKGAPRLSTTATRKGPIGHYPIVVKQGTLRLINKNYTFKFLNGILHVV